MEVGDVVLEDVRREQAIRFEIRERIFQFIQSEPRVDWTGDGADAPNPNDRWEVGGRIRKIDRYSIPGDDITVGEPCSDLVSLPVDVCIRIFGAVGFDDGRRITLLFESVI